jgi:hypothetical protein
LNAAPAPSHTQRIRESLGHHEIEGALAPATFYFLSSDVALPVRIRIGEVRGTFPPRPSAADGAGGVVGDGTVGEGGGSFAEQFAAQVGATSADVYVVAQLFSRGVPLCAAQRTAVAAADSVNWGEWLCRPHRPAPLQPARPPAGRPEATPPPTRAAETARAKTADDAGRRRTGHGGVGRCYNSRAALGRRRRQRARRGRARGRADASRASAAPPRAQSRALVAG